MTWMVPVALFVALHTGTLLWFLSGTSTSLRYLAQQVGDLKIELARLRQWDTRVAILEARVEELGRRIEHVQ